MTEEKDKSAAPGSRIYVGVKWGLQLPTVMLAARFTPTPVDHIHIIRELYEKELLLEDLIKTGREWKEELMVRKFFCDPTQPEFIARMRKARLWAVPVGQELNLAVNLIKKRIRFQAVGQKKIVGLEVSKKEKWEMVLNCPGGLTFSPDCPNVILEIPRYHAIERKGNRPVKDKPLEMDDDSLKALHFLVTGLATERVPRVTWV